MTQKKLFEIQPEDPNKSKDTCKDCQHRERWDYSGKIFQYCGIRKSRRTSNGLLKIKCKNIACEGFKRAEI